MPKSMSGIGASKLMGDSKMIGGCVVATHALQLMVVRSYVASLHNFHETSVCLPRRTGCLSDVAVVRQRQECFCLLFG
jgi:hypothetical protein